MISPSYLIVELASSLSALWLKASKTDILRTSAPSRGFFHHPFRSQLGVSSINQMWGRAGLGWSNQERHGILSNTGVTKVIVEEMVIRRTALVPVFKSEFEAR